MQIYKHFLLTFAEKSLYSFAQDGIERVATTNNDLTVEK